MGIGVVLLSVGFSLVFGLPHGLALQIGLVVGAVVLTIGATTSGVDRGIRWISELNLWSAVAMMVYILVTGETAFLMNALVENIGRFIVALPERTLRGFVIAAITAPVLCDFIIVSLFGNSALFQVLQGNTTFAELAEASSERGWYALLEMFPGAMFLIGLATLSGLLFYLTSANSGAVVM